MALVHREPATLRNASVAMLTMACLSAGCTQTLHQGDSTAVESSNIDQLTVETLAVRLRSEQTVKVALEAVKVELRQRPGMDSEDGVVTLDRAAEEFAFAGLLTSANSDPAHPRIVWFNTPAHRTGDLDVPGSRIGFDNTDRVYRVFPATPDFSYVITGQVDASQEALTLLLEACEDKPPGWGYPLAFLYPEDIELDIDGRFRITVDSTPADGRKNHLTLPPGTGHVLIRDTITDWSADTPARLSVARTSGTDSAPMSYAQMLAQAPQRVADQTQYGLEWYEADTGFSGPANLAKNTIPTVYVRPTAPGRSAWGMIGVGKYSVAEDEALVFTLEAQEAGYVGLQITDPWMISIDFTKHTSTLNNAEVWTSPEDTITYVLSPTDPGVLNWLDTGGLNDGVMLLRWERIAGQPKTDTALRSVKLIKLRELEQHIPAAMPRVNTARRDAIRQARATGFAAREKALLAPQ